MEQMAARLDQMEREHANLKQSNQGPRDAVTALRAAKERLQSEVDRLDHSYKARTKEYCDQVWQYNRSMVFMNAVHATLEALTTAHRPKKCDEVSIARLEELLPHRRGRVGTRHRPSRALCSPMSRPGSDG